MKNVVYVLVKVVTTFLFVFLLISYFFAGFFGQFGVIKRLRIARNKKVRRLDHSFIYVLHDDITFTL